MNGRLGAKAASDSPRGDSSLRERAVAILGDAPNGVDASALAEQLFGAGSGPRWVPLLSAVLGGDDRLSFADGRWRLASTSRPEATSSSGSERPAHSVLTSPKLALPNDGIVVTLALATTGADPHRHRIARIAVVRHQHGEITARLDCALNCDRRPARYLRNAARIDADELETAPTFADLVPDLRAFLDGHTVHAYGARRSQAFLDAELRRAGLPGLDVQFVELDVLVAPLLSGTRKPGLFPAADELGIQHTGRDSPLADAELSARVLARVRERLATSPARPGPDPSSSAPDSTKPLPFTREWLNTVPVSPGVYVFEDETGRALYVGKAIDLRRRLSSYVGRQPSLERRLESLAVRAAAVSTVAVPSDLEATLLEARLLCERSPAFNVARATRLPTSVIRAALDGRLPGIRLVARIAADGARYFGPFESVSAARQALAIARAAYPDAFARLRCELTCQREAILQVCQLLAGQKQPTLDALRAQMQAAASAGDQTEVDRLRVALRAVQGFVVRHSDLAGLTPGWRLLVLERVYERCGRLHLIRDGRLVASAHTDTSALPTEPGRLVRFVTDAFPDGADDRDVARPDVWTDTDTTILARWLAQARQRLEIRRLPPEERRNGD